MVTMVMMVMNFGVGALHGQNPMVSAENGLQAQWTCLHASGTRGAVATEVDVCSNVDADILLQGGNAEKIDLSPPLTMLEWAASYPAIPGWVGFDNSTAAYLAQLGHNVTFVAPGSSTAQGIQVFSNGTIKGWSDVRQLSARAAAV
ncbi:hypothetical protein DFJ73DRAFT_775338 [Zopfochytrium polystomum]|nr:hypothetical protein DFJ73DRAFT_775338 [Zopfochytrium polystomum]